MYPFLHFVDVESYARFDVGVSFLVHEEDEAGRREAGFCIGLGFMMLFIGIGHDPNRY